MFKNVGDNIFLLRIPRPPLNRRAIREWWEAENGYRTVLMFAWPLFMAQASSTVLQFIDRMFLTWYSPEGMAATGPAGMLAYTVQALFLGLAGYSSVFVAQYTGAGKRRQAAAVVWQGLYLAILSSLIILLLIPIGGEVFRLAGHNPAVQAAEHTYFNIFIYGSFTFISSAALFGYFIGRGKTRLVLQINLVGVMANIVLDYFLIFGQGGFPRLGVAGAALASVIAQGVVMLLNFYFFLRETHADGIYHAWNIDLPLTRRLLHYGSANGVQFTLDALGWTVFLLLVGRLGITPLAATNLAFQLNSILFLPILGFSMGASMLVGQSLGKNRPDLADRSVWSAIHLSLLFTFGLGIFLVLIPKVLLAPFGIVANPAEFAPVRDLAVILLRFVAAYCLFDVGNIILSSALRGAGDTIFVMLLTISVLTIVMIVPIILWCLQPDGLGINGAWSFLTLTVCVLSFFFLMRYLRGRWQGMRVIEREVI